MSNEHVHPIFAALLSNVAPKEEPVACWKCEGRGKVYEWSEPDEDSMYATHPGKMLWVTCDECEGTGTHD